MTAKLFTLPKAVILSNSGVLIPGAKAYFYVAGTTTPQSVYSEYTLTTAHTNPVVADGDGRFPAIYYDSQLNYKVKLTNASDVEIYSQDYAVSSLTTAEVGAALYPVTPEETSAAIVPVNLIYPSGNVLRYTTNAVPGTTDMSSAFTAANTVGGGVYVPDGIYAANSLTLTTDLYMDPGAVLYYNGAQNGSLVTLGADNLHVPFFHGDMNGIDCSLLTITGNNCQVGDVRLDNGVASVTSSTSIYGLNLTGDRNVVDSVVVDNFVNTGQANESFPQAVFFLGDDNHIESITGHTSATLVATSSASGVSTIGTITAHNCLDNGFYLLGGDVSVDFMTYYGTQEALVIIGTLNMGILQCVGPCIPIGVQSSGDVTIANVILKPNAAGNGPTTLLRTRASNVASGKVSLGNVTFDMPDPETLILLNVGTVEYLTIGQMSGRYVYNTLTSGAITQWCNLSGALGFDIRDVTVKIIDSTDALTSGDTFSVIAPTTNLARPSVVQDFDVIVLDTDEITISDAGIRGAGFKDAGGLIDAYGQKWQINIGPYFKEADYAANRDSALATPAVGYWKVGQTLWNSTPAAGEPMGWICTVAGSPGTWLPIGAVQSANAYTLNATAVPDRTLLASASATTINNNNVLAALITDLKASGVLL